MHFSNISKRKSHWSLSMFVAETLSKKQTKKPPLNTHTQKATVEIKWNVKKNLLKTIF